MSHVYALVPAAGCGSRFGEEIPKQYLSLSGKPMIWHALAALCAYPRIERVWVVVAPDDTYWSHPNWRELWLSLGHKLEVVACGGGSRAESVMNGLAAAATAIAPEDWVLVHDAARPCLSSALIGRLIETLQDDPVGGLLAAPLADTLKRADAGQRVADTVPRAGLWRAQTPQMFRYGALSAALARHPDVTDEAAAMEAAGFAPKLVESCETNLKVTYPDDLTLAAWILHGRRAAE